MLPLIEGQYQGLSFMSDSHGFFCETICGYGRNLATPPSRDLPQPYCRRDNRSPRRTGYSPRSRAYSSTLTLPLKEGREGSIRTTPSASETYNFTRRGALQRTSPGKTRQKWTRRAETRRPGRVRTYLFPRPVLPKHFGDEKHPTAAPPSLRQFHLKGQTAPRSRKQLGC